MVFVPGTSNSVPESSGVTYIRLLVNVKQEASRGRCSQENGPALQQAGQVHPGKWEAEETCICIAITQDLTTGPIHFTLSGYSAQSILFQKTHRALQLACFGKITALNILHTQWATVHCPCFMPDGSKLCKVALQDVFLNLGTHESRGCHSD